MIQTYLLNRRGTQGWIKVSSGLHHRLVSTSAKAAGKFPGRTEVRRYAPRTGKTYKSWIRSFFRFHHLRHPREMGTAEILQFLTHLAVVVRLIYGTGLRIE